MSSLLPLYLYRRFELLPFALCVSIKIIRVIVETHAIIYSSGFQIIKHEFSRVELSDRKYRMISNYYIAISNRRIGDKQNWLCVYRYELIWFFFCCMHKNEEKKKCYTEYIFSSLTFCAYDFVRLDCIEILIVVPVPGYRNEHYSCYSKGITSIYTSKTRQHTHTQKTSFHANMTWFSIRI